MIFIYLFIYLFLSFIPIGVGHYLIYKLQQAVNIIRDRFLIMHNVSNFNTWCYTELKNEVIARGINDTKKIKRLKKNINWRIKEMSAGYILSNIPSWFYNSLTSAIISIMVLNVKAINNLEYEIMIVVGIFATVAIISHLNTKIPNLSLYFRNKYSTVRDLKILIKYLDELPLESEIK